MARIKLDVSKKDLLDQITQLESKQTFPNVNALCVAVADTPWAKSNKITTAIVTLRIKEFGLLSEIKTKPGKRGRQPGEKLTDEHKDKLLAGRGKKEVSKSWVSELRKMVPTTDSKGNKTDRFLKIVDKIEAGSVKASIKLHCLECSGFDSKEVKRCQVFKCPLWGIRAYQ